MALQYLSMQNLQGGIAQKHGNTQPYVSNCIDVFLDVAILLPLIDSIVFPTSKAHFAPLV